MLVRDAEAGEISLGSIVPFFIYFQRLTDSIGGLTNLVDKLVEHRTAIVRFADAFPLHVASASKGKHETFPVNWSTISFNNVSFRYAKAERPTLDDASLRVSRGEVIEISGESGSGKSTLVKLLLGMYDPQQGQILVDSTNISTVDSDTLRHHVAVVPQEAELFAWTLRQNLTLFRNVDARRLEEAIYIACLEDLVRALPGGLDSPVGERGHTLSGGQRQRVAIARALCGTADILVLDEATVGVETELERRLMERLIKARPDLTIIIIAHKGAALEFVKRRLRVQEGRVVELPG